MEAREMIKPHEIRIGNRLFFLSKEVEIKGIYQKHYPQAYIDIGDGVDHKIMHFRPIPISEEWLIRLGLKFERWSTGAAVCTRHTGFWMLNEEVVLYGSNGKRFDCFYLGNREYEMPYVHSVQNFIFSLTGIELTIKEE